MAAAMIARNSNNNSNPQLKAPQKSLSLKAHSEERSIELAGADQFPTRQHQVSMQNPLIQQ
jgi:hypothetical protein